MIIKVKSVQKFTTSDSAEFDTREEAVAHETYLTRKKALDGIEFDLPNSDDVDQPCVYMEDVADFIAAHGDKILEALTVKQNRGRKAKAAA